MQNFQDKTKQDNKGFLVGHCFEFDGLMLELSESEYKGINKPDYKLLLVEGNRKKWLSGLFKTKDSTKDNLILSGDIKDTKGVKHWFYIEYQPKTGSLAFLNLREALKWSKEINRKPIVIDDIFTLDIEPITIQDTFTLDIEPITILDTLTLDIEPTKKAKPIKKAQPVLAGFKGKGLAHD